MSVYVMMSGGVDSSVAAYEVLKQGYSTKGVFMKCWSLEALQKLGVSEDLYGCFWEDDVQDAQLVAKKLGIDFEVWDLQKEYQARVVDYMLEEYRIGRTPNPDVMCNSMIKFGAFYAKAMEQGAEFVATGHYARIENGHILRALDTQKDQSYFLWGVGQTQLAHTLLPIGEYAKKSLVREKAQELDLITASKPDSQGLCFVGSTPLRELLLQTIGAKPGKIIDTTGKVLGEHSGAFLYTIGQREKLGLGGGPWYVADLDVVKNTVTVSHSSLPEPLLSKSLIAKGLNWQITPSSQEFEIYAQVRYRQTPIACKIKIIDKDEVLVEFNEPVRAVALGQSVVFYDGEKMLGGGIISSKTGV